MSDAKCRILMRELNKAYVELCDEDAAVELVATNEFFLYYSITIECKTWIALIDDVNYIIWFDGSFYVRER